jgi:tetratricopeptide (TPR) repeat protein
MTESRAIACCLLSCLMLPLKCHAQSQLANGHPSTPKYVNGSMVSARDLRIPEKARKAFYRGTQRMAARDWSGSIPEFEKAIKAFADLYEAYYKIGIAELELQQGPQAETAFRRSIELSAGRYAPALFGLGLTLSHGGKFAEAESVVRAGLDLEPLDAAGHFTMAWVLYAGEKIGEAEKSALQAVQYNPDFAMAHLLLAQIHRRQNNQQAVVADLDAFLRLDPDGPRSSQARAVRAAAQSALQQRQETTLAAAAP